VNSDVVEWAQDHLGLQSADADDAEAVARSYLLDFILSRNPALLHHSDVHVRDMSIGELTYIAQQLSVEAYRAADERMDAVVSSVPDEVLTLARGSVLGILNYEEQVIQNLPAAYRDPIQQVQAEMGDLGRFYHDTLTLQQAYRGQYEQDMSADLRLILMVASIVAEPIDWVVTGVEVIQDVREGDWENALENVILAGVPFAGGWMNDAAGMLRHAPDEPVGGGTSFSAAQGNEIPSRPAVANFTQTVSRGYPNGFDSLEEFRAFGIQLQTGLVEAGYTDVQLAMRGSSITGVRFVDGSPFDSGGNISDFDVAVVSSQKREKLFD
jgi:hypothetical protein